LKKLIFLAVFMTACGPTWSDCPNCETPIAPVEVPTIVVNVDNDVNVSVNQSTSVQVEEDDGDGKCTTCPAPVTLDAGAPHTDPPKDCVCKKVCKEYKRVHVGHTKSTCKDRSKDKLVCTKTVLECVKS
jgi:hypothetical protein